MIYEHICDIQYKMEVDDLFRIGYIILPSLISSETCDKLKNDLE